MHIINQSSNQIAITVYHRCEIGCGPNKKYTLSPGEKVYPHVIQLSACARGREPIGPNYRYCVPNIHVVIDRPYFCQTVSELYDIIVTDEGVKIDGLPIDRLKKWWNNLW